MELFRLILYKKRYYFLGILLVLPLLLFAVTRFRVAATDAQIKNMLNVLEVFYPFFASLFVCCIIHRMTEAELIVLSGESMAHAAFSEFIVFFALSLVSGLVAGLLLLPGWMMTRFLFSFPVTLLFLLSMALAIRFAVNNVYGVVGVHTGLFLLLYLRSGMSPETTVTRSLTKIDLFVDGYAHQIYSDSSGYWYLLTSDVAVNRLIILTLAVVILVLSYFLSKQSRLYNIKL